MTRHEVLVAPDGALRFIYSDALAGALAKLGPQVTRRASHVEPLDGGDFARQGWRADMAPVGGPVLGPFPTRALALEAEADWLLAHEVPVPA